jgi:uncharacterized phiE125 gp8 family phage protein
MVLVTPPAVEPWTLQDAQVSHALRLDGNYDSLYVTLILEAARRYFEQQTGLCLITQTWRASFDDVPCEREISLPRAPIASVTSVLYTDEDGGEQTLASADYAIGSVGASGSFGRVRLKSTASWPTLGDYPDALRVTFTAGFGAAASNIPNDVRLALLLLTAWWYEQRLPVNVGNIVNALPHSLDALLRMHRVAHIA